MTPFSIIKYKLPVIAEGTSIKRILAICLRMLSDEILASGYKMSSVSIPLNSLCLSCNRKSAEALILFLSKFNGTGCSIWETENEN